MQKPLTNPPPPVVVSICPSGLVSSMNQLSLCSEGTTSTVANSDVASSSTNANKKKNNCCQRCKKRPGLGPCSVARIDTRKNIHALSTTRLLVALALMKDNPARVVWVISCRRGSE
uniref:Uncharacterized protein n=1 Tax=Davidia involucrata TaxID=16924 RepID=A0A5B7BLX8_DAVIN